MAVQLTVLGSGSTGNATLLSYGAGRLLIDAGLSGRELTRRLQSVGVEPASIRAIVVTHPHGDHAQGAVAFSRRYSIPVYGTVATRETWRSDASPAPAWHILAPGQAVDLCGVRLHPFGISHDALETLAFRIETPEGVIGFATDIGTTTAELGARFRDCVLLVIESNHASELLRIGPYVPSLKSRIRGPEGHLSNEALADFIARYLGARVRCLVLAHLSRVNNVPELAEISCREALERRGRRDVRIVVALPDRCTETIDLASLGSVRPLRAPAAATLWQERLPFA